MQLDLRISRMFAVAIVILIATGALAGLAVAAPEQTRETYVGQVEPICKANTEANERFLSGVRKQIKEGKLRVAAAEFAQAAAASAKSVKQIKGVAQPAADKPKLTKWIGYLEDEQALLSEIGKALKAGKKSKVPALSLRLVHTGNLANSQVFSFEFNYCEVDTSKLGG